MKKIYSLLALALAMVSTDIKAQTSPRVVLFEEFTGENCPPCASTNPWLKRFSDLNAQDSFIHVAYQVNIPSAGPIYNAYKTDANARMTYYGVNSAPWGQNDGLTYLSTWAGSATQPITYIDSTSFGASPAASQLTSVGFNARRAIHSPCTISIQHWFSANYDSVYAMAIVNTTSTYRSTAAGSLHFQLALTEKLLTYATPPGTNGETEFYNVVRKMYPSNTGTVMVDSLWSGKADTFRVAALIPSYLREINQIQFIGWVQDNSTKEIKQSGSSKLLANSNLVDILVYGDSVSKVLCTNGTTASSYAFCNVKNTGSVNITTMTVKVYDATALINTVPWTGTLIPGDVAQVNVGPLSLTAGTHALKFIASNPNGTNVHSATYDTVKPTQNVVGASVASPYVQNFEGGAFPPANCVNVAETDGYAFLPSNAYGTTGNTYWGAESTTNSMFLAAYYNTSGQISDFYMPKLDFRGTPNTKITFWHAYRPYTDQNSVTANDQLDLQASTDCGTTWTSLWSSSGTALGTPTTSTASPYKPTAAADWVKHSVSLGAFATQNNVWIRFHGTSDYGDNVWVDQINIDQALGINDPENVQVVNLYPNPANDNLTVEMSISKSANYSMNIVNTLGQTVKNVFEGDVNEGNRAFDFNVAALQAGIYNLEIISNNQKIVKRFVISH